jgi:hypothetical protein
MSTHLPFNERKTQPFLRGSNQAPSLAVRHSHLIRRLAKRSCLPNSFQEFVGTFPESLSIAVEPNLIDNLHAFSSGSLFLKEDNEKLKQSFKSVKVFKSSFDGARKGPSIFNSLIIAEVIDETLPIPYTMSHPSPGKKRRLPIHDPTVFRTCHAVYRIGDP